MTPDKLEKICEEHQIGWTNSTEECQLCSLRVQARELTTDRDAQAQRVQALEGGIKKFGAHDLFCPASAMIDMSKPELRGPCNCGLDAALQEPT